MDYENSMNFATTNFMSFPFCKKLRFFSCCEHLCGSRIIVAGWATQVGRGHVRTALLLVSASAESAHAPHSSHTRTNEGKRTGRHLPDEDCSGLTQSQRDSNRARTEFWCFPLSFPLGNAGTSSRAPTPRDAVPAFPNGKDKGRHQNSVLAPLPLLRVA